MFATENLSESEKNRYNEGLPKEVPIVIPVIAETARVDKQVVTTGKIRIEKGVEEVNETVEVNVLHDEYTVKRVAVNKYVDEGTPQVRYEGDTLIIPVVKEVMVKRLLLVEEVHVIKEVKSTTEQVDIPLRKETVTVTRTTNLDQSSA